MLASIRRFIRAQMADLGIGVTSVRRVSETHFEIDVRRYAPIREFEVTVSFADP